VPSSRWTLIGYTSSTLILGTAADGDRRAVKTNGVVPGKESSSTRLRARPASLETGTWRKSRSPREDVATYPT
jgi:hypothetical protein